VICVRFVTSARRAAVDVPLGLCHPPGMRIQLRNVGCAADGARAGTGARGAYLLSVPRLPAGPPLGRSYPSATVCASERPPSPWTGEYTQRYLAAASLRASCPACAEWVPYVRRDAATGVGRPARKQESLPCDADSPDESIPAMADSGGRLGSYMYRVPGVPVRGPIGSQREFSPACCLRTRRIKFLDRSNSDAA
jgi:hypothetical protein